MRPAFFLTSNLKQTLKIFQFILNPKDCILRDRNRKGKKSMNSNLNTNAITNTKNTSSVEQNKRQDKIVICDDDKDIVRALEIYLSNRDYELLSAYTGREALDYVKKR